MNKFKPYDKACVEGQALNIGNLFYMNDWEIIIFRRVKGNDKVLFQKAMSKPNYKESQGVWFKEVRKMKEKENSPITSRDEYEMRNYPYTVDELIDMANAEAYYLNEEYYNELLKSKEKDNYSYSEEFFNDLEKAEQLEREQYGR